VSPLFEACPPTLLSNTTIFGGTLYKEKNAVIVYIDFKKFLVGGVLFPKPALPNCSHFFHKSKKYTYRLFKDTLIDYTKQKDLNSTYRLKEIYSGSVLLPMPLPIRSHVKYEIICVCVPVCLCVHPSSHSDKCTTRANTLTHKRDRMGEKAGRV